MVGFSTALTLPKFVLPSGKSFSRAAAIHPGEELRMSDKKKQIEKYLEADQIGKTEKGRVSDGSTSFDSAIRMKVEKELAEKGKEASDSAPEKAQEPVSEDIAPEGELEKAHREAAESRDKYLRLYAEFENYKKRTARETADYRRYSNEALLKEMLAVADNLERAVESINEQSENDSALVKGVQLTLKEIFAILERYNVTPIDAVGKQFDPRYHLAFQQEESDEFPENTVIREYQKGFLLHDRLLRPSMVVVSKRRQNLRADQNSE